MLSVQIDRIIPIDEVKEEFEKIVEEVSEGGGDNNLFILTREGKPAVAIVNIKYLSDLTGDDIISDANFTDDDGAKEGPDSPGGGTLQGATFGKDGSLTTPAKGGARQFSAPAALAAPAGQQSSQSVPPTDVGAPAPTPPPTLPTPSPSNTGQETAQPSTPSAAPAPQSPPSSAAQSNRVEPKDLDIG